MELIKWTLNSFSIGKIARIIMALVCRIFVTNHIAESMLPKAQHALKKVSPYSDCIFTVSQLNPLILHSLFLKRLLTKSVGIFTGNANRKWLTTPHYKSFAVSFWNNATNITTARVGKLTAEVNQCVRQGCPFPPVLCNFIKTELFSGDEIHYKPILFSMERVAFIALLFGNDQLLPSQQTTRSCLEIKPGYKEI
jgi:hypothetical protein